MKKKTGRLKMEESERIIRSVVVPPDVDRKLLALAKKEDRSLSWMIVRAIREMLDRDEKSSGS
jgi:predicted transcriptional regulator